jgi:hypothetical protein
MENFKHKLIYSKKNEMLMVDKAFYFIQILNHNQNEPHLIITG